MSNVDILIKKARYNDEPELNNDTNMAVKTLVQSFPVNTEQQLILLEEWLSSSADNIHALVCKLFYVFLNFILRNEKIIFE